MNYKIVARAGMVGDAGASLAKIDGQLVESLLVSEEDIIRDAGDADAVIVGPTEPYTRQVIEALTKCKVISRSGIGCNNIDLLAATKVGIPVAYVPDASTVEVSDHALALLLSLSRRIIPINKLAKDGTWQPGKTVIPSVMKPIRRLSEQTLGLYGLGRIGSSVCKKARGFGLKVLTYDPFVSDAVAIEKGAEKVDFEELLIRSDYISLHAPLTRETAQVFGLDQFKKMKPTAYIINTARGGLINEPDLVTAIKDGLIAGAGLDVTDPEPPKQDNPLLELESVIITAHTSFYSERSVSELSQNAVEAVVAALQGQWPRNIINPDVKNRANCRLKVSKP